MISARYFKYLLHFKKPSGTSRGILTHKETWFIIVEENGRKGIGECGILRGLSADDTPEYEEKLKWACDNINVAEETLWLSLIDYPSIQFGVEMAFRSMESEDPYILFRSGFTSGRRPIPINGLVWMGNEDVMLQEIQDKIAAGFRCIKLKIGAIDFGKELSLLQHIRSHFTSGQIEIRVDANGAFHPDQALHKIKQLSEFKIHSIEQPIATGQAFMAELCRKSEIPIALDEELIGVFTFEEKEKLICRIQPQFIILKPSFIGGFRGTDEWIALAEKYNIGWWITSALESNIGLNAIAQWTFQKDVAIPQGLGTGALYTNNIESPLSVNGGNLWYDVKKSWRDFQV